MQRALQLDAEWDHATTITEALSASHDNISLGPVMLCTMTVLCETNIDRVDVNKLKCDFTTNPSCMGDGIEPAKSFARFGSAVTFSYRALPGCSISIKVFSTGVLHLTGIKSATDAINVTEDMCNRLAKVLNNDNKGKAFAPTDLSIKMINSTTCIPWAINLKALHNELRIRHPSTHTTFNLEKHPGVQIHVPSPVPAKQGKTISVFAFASGKILITGISDASELIVGVHFLLSTIDACFAQVCEKLPPPRPKGKRGRKPKSESRSFYDTLIL